MDGGSMEDCGERVGCARIRAEQPNVALRPGGTRRSFYPWRAGRLTFGMSGGARGAKRPSHVRSTEGLGGTSSTEGDQVAKRQTRAQTTSATATNHGSKRDTSKPSASVCRKSLAADRRPHSSQRTCVAISGTAGAAMRVETAVCAHVLRLGQQGQLSSAVPAPLT